MSPTRVQYTGCILFLVGPENATIWEMLTFSHEVTTTTTMLQLYRDKDVATAVVWRLVLLHHVVVALKLTHARRTRGRKARTNNKRMRGTYVGIQAREVHKHILCPHDRRSKGKWTTVMDSAHFKGRDTSNHSAGVACRKERITSTEVNTFQIGVGSCAWVSIQNAYGTGHHSK